MSKQIRWQQRKRAAGLCRTCGKPAAIWTPKSTGKPKLRIYCDYHAQADRLRKQ